MPAPSGSVLGYTLTIPYRAGVVASRPELVGLDAATCGGTWLGHGLKKTEPYIS